MDRVLITGALGQLGTSLQKALNKKGDFVIATDIRDTTKNIECQYEKLDVLSYDELYKIVKKYKINVIYHLVAILSAKGEKNPFNSWNINMETFQNIIDVSIKCKIKKIFCC